MTAGRELGELLGTERAPIAIAFRDSAPDGIPRIDSRAASGCTYWKLAASGRTFFTEASDHFGCPVGCHTHGIDMPEETAQELEGLIGTMVQLEYLSIDEVPGIPRRTRPFGVALYGPLADASFEADVIMVAGNARQLMLLAEAAHAAGVNCESSVVGRPTCAAIPAVMESGRGAANLGCIGNRVYTEMSDDELYFAFPAKELGPIVAKLRTIVNANRELEKFHLARV